MSKAFTSDDVVAQEAQLPMPVGRRPITQRGFDKLRRELRTLVDAALPAKVAASAAQDVQDVQAQAQVQGQLRRIAHLERRLALSDVAEAPVAPFARVVLGTRVTVEEDETGEALVYVLVGPDEVDIPSRRISCASPVGQALLGRKLGERAFIKRPAGVLEVVVKEIAADG